MILAIIQARLTSTRFPKKILEKIDDKTMVDWVISKVKSIDEIDFAVVATPHEITNLDIPLFIGDEEDVLDRYYKCASYYEADTIVRITSDCPLLDPEIISFAIYYFRTHRFPYITIAPVDGLDVEVFSMKMLKEAWENATSKFDREHVTPYMKRATKLSVDTREDLERVRKWVHELV